VHELRAALMPTPAAGAEPEDVRAEVAAAVRGRSRDAEAHRLYLQGRHFALQKRPEELAKGIDQLRAAVERDPNHAVAWAELGAALADRVFFGLATTGEGYSQARDAVSRSLEIEPGLPEGHARMARIQAVHDWDWRGAEASFRRALDGDPGSVTALTGAGILAQGLGRSEEAIALNLRSIARDPLSSAAHNNLGSLYYESGRLAEAEAAFRASLELSPRRYGTRSFLAQVLMELGRGEEALAEAQQEPDETFRLLALALIHHRSGRAKDSDSAVRELIEKYAAECPLQVAEAYGTRGEVDSAFEWLERALGERDAGLTHIKPNPHFRALRHDPRWPVFLAKLGLAD